MFIRHFRRHNNYYSHYYTYFFIICCPQNTLICKLDTVYRHIVYNVYIFHIVENLFMAIIHTFCITKNGILNHCYIFHNIVENHRYIKFGIKIKNDLWLKQKSHCFCIFMSFYKNQKQNKKRTGVLYRGHNITWIKYNFQKCYFSVFFLSSKQYNDMKKY